MNLEDICRAADNHIDGLQVVYAAGAASVVIPEPTSPEPPPPPVMVEAVGTDSTVHLTEQEE